MVVGGVDVGGTFTDVVVSAEGSVSVYKLPSTKDQSEGVVEGLKRALKERDLPPKQVEGFLHGTTVATNALLEGGVSRGRSRYDGGVPGRPGDRASEPSGDV